MHYRRSYDFSMPDDRDPNRSVAAFIHDPRVLDPGQDVVSTSELSQDDIAQVVRVLDAIREWREAEQRLSLATRSDMQLGENDMKALRFLVLCKNQNIVATPGALSEHLNISSAATTKLLDRLAEAGHIQRSPHPSDRRAITITITQSTHELGRDTVGKTHAHRFEAAARLTPEEREIVIRFLADLSSP
jgi:DNA-binding MarR family transcriptional regulator